MRLAISEIIEATSGEAIVAPASADALVVGLTWDSRNVSAGCLYVALPGERVDGHTFVTGAIEAGAACALVTQEPDAAAIDTARTAGAAIVLVSDAQQALIDLARFWRGLQRQNDDEEPGARRSFRRLCRDGHVGQPEQRAWCSEDHSERFG